MTEAGATVFVVDDSCSNRFPATRVGLWEDVPMLAVGFKQPKRLARVRTPPRTKSVQDVLKWLARSSQYYTEQMVDRANHQNQIPCTSHKSAGICDR
jgi:hypothetical protein